jgi:hypothetical protein
MPRFRLTIARDRSEYASVDVKAATMDEAEERIEKIFVDNEDYDADYCQLVNNVSWDSGNESDNERIVDIEAIEEDE